MASVAMLSLQQIDLELSIINKSPKLVLDPASVIRLTELEQRKTELEGKQSLYLLFFIF